jgi:hypothetical protein
MVTNGISADAWFKCNILIIVLVETIHVVDRCVSGMSEPTALLKGVLVWLQNILIRMEMRHRGREGAELSIGLFFLVYKSSSPC